MSKITFYHGTTDKFPIKNVILPAVITGVKREEWRTKYIDKVFFSSSLGSALMYAKKACTKYGGNPIVYVVRPKGKYFNTINSEYIADRAYVLDIIKEKKI